MSTAPLHAAHTGLFVITPLFVGTFATPAMAQEADAPSAFSAGAQVDNESGQRLALGLTVGATPATSFTLQGVVAETELNSTDTRTSMASAAIEHDFDAFGASLGLRHAEGQDVNRSLAAIGTLFRDFGTTRLTAMLEGRQIEFDDSAFTTQAADLGLPIGTVSGTAACDADSIGYGLGLRRSGSTGAFYAAASAYEYTSYRCDVVLDSGGDPLRRNPGRAIFNRLAGGITDQLRGFSATRAPRDALLLESALMIGGARYLGDRALGFELYHDTEEFGGEQATTALGFFEWPLTRATRLQASVGATDAESGGTPLFAGVTVFMQIGR